MSALHDVSNVYIDFEQTLANTDLFVCKYLYKAFKKDESIISKSPLHTFFKIIDKVGEDMIKDFVQTKRNVNPLREIIDISKLSNAEMKKYWEYNFTEDMIKDTISDDIYVSTLYYPYKVDISEDMEFTNLASSLKILTRDVQLEHIYVYCKFFTEAIYDAISTHFEVNDKVQLVSGDKGDFLNKVRCNNYFFADVNDINLLPVGGFRDAKSPADVVFLNTTQNQELWASNEYIGESRTHKEYCKKFNIDVSIIK